MNIIDQLLKPGYQVTDEACNAYCYQTEGKATSYLCAIAAHIFEDEVVILEVDFINSYVLIYKPDIETAVAKILFSYQVNMVSKPEL